MNRNIPSETEFYNALALRHGADFQEKIKKSAVAVCGLGGLGSNIAIALARAGVGRLLLFDFDKVDVSNLNRQQYFAHQTGIYKTDALTDILRMVNPYCRVDAVCTRLTEDNIPGLLSDADVICEAFDAAEQKAMLVNCVLENFPEKYIISGSGMAGLHSADLIKTRSITKRFFVCGDESSDTDNEGSLVSARVMVCAGHQALTAIKILTDNMEDLKNEQ